MFCTPAPLGSSFNLIVKSFVDIAVTSYSFPVSPVTGVVPAESEKKEIMSPTLITLLAKSASSTAIVVAPTASSPTVKLLADKTCSYAVAVAQIATPIELPHVPADLAAHSPCEPWPALNDCS